MDLSEAPVSVELQTPDMTLNIGPQHPSTHGVLRLVAEVDGERIARSSRSSATCTAATRSSPKSAPTPRSPP